ncbi:hypothetical protein G6F57_023331 [Rhizopus arrhizus]|nr:hypothetical protein G6F57_023331 [Rhizopus arrhizus]
MRVAGDGLAVDQHRAAQHHQHAVAARGDGKRRGLARIQPHVPHVHGREGARRTGLAREVARDHAQRTRIVRQRHHGDAG